MSVNVSPVMPGLATDASAKSVELSPFSWQDTTQRNAWIAATASAAGLVWAYWLMFSDAAEQWSQPQYSHGWVLPIIALYMMWRLRPNKKPDARVDGVLRVFAGVGVALIAAGQGFESLRFLQGVGLATICLGGFGCIMWGQPFATLVARNNTNSFSRPEVLWGIVGAGCGVAALGLAGLSVGPLDAAVFTIAGLFVMMLGIVLTAVIVPPSPVITLHEVAAGTFVTLLCTIAWFYAVLYDRMPLAEAAFVTTALGMLMVIGGMRLVRWAGPPVAFLMFMFPLPMLVERSVLPGLQKIAVVLSEMVYTLIGVSAIRTGNRIELPGLENPIEMEVAEACSGLSMTNILVAMCVAMVILMDRPWWDRLIVMLSALPIAIVSNVFRIVLTGLIWILIDRLYVSDPEYAAQLRDPIHSWLGLIVMMPFALGLMLLELKILTMLSVPEESSLGKPQVLGRGAGAPVQ